jgi:hypothetical protein
MSGSLHGSEARTALERNNSKASSNPASDGNALGMPIDRFDDAPQAFGQGAKAAIRCDCGVFDT